MTAFFSFIWYSGRSYWVRDGCSAIIFVKNVKIVFVHVLSCSTECSKDAWIVALLGKLPQMPSWCHHAAQTTPTWTKTILTCFTKLIAVQPSMAEYKWTMYQMKEELRYHALKSVLLYLFFRYWEISSQTRVSIFFFKTHTVYCMQ